MQSHTALPATGVTTKNSLDALSHSTYAAVLNISPLRSLEAKYRVQEQEFDTPHDILTRTFNLTFILTSNIPPLRSLEAKHRKHFDHK